MGSCLIANGRLRRRWSGRGHRRRRFTRGGANPEHDPLQRRLGHLRCHPLATTHLVMLCVVDLHDISGDLAWKHAVGGGGAQNRHTYTPLGQAAKQHTSHTKSGSRQPLNTVKTYKGLQLAVVVRHVGQLEGQARRGSGGRREPRHALHHRRTDADNSAKHERWQGEEK